MEPLVLPFLELVRALHGVAEGTVVGLVLIVVGLIAAILNRRLAARTIEIAAEEGPAIPPSRERLEVSTAPRVSPTLRPRSASEIATIRQVLRSLMVVGVLCTAALAAVEYFGTEHLLRWSLGKLQTRTGVSLTFGKATGGPLSGELILHQVRVVRDNHAHSNFDLAASQVTIHFSIWKFLGSKLRFDAVRVDQVSGNYQRVGRLDTATETQSELPKSSKPARNIPIGHLEIREATIDCSDSTVEGEPVEFGLVVNSLVCAPFRTGYAPYDIVFRSDVEGTLDQQPFRIFSTETPTERQTEWRATGIPVKFARAYLGGPFRWLAAGKCDVQVTQTTDQNPRAPVILAARISLRDIRAGLPGNVKPAVAIAAQALMSQIKYFPKEKVLEFKLKLDPETFDLTKIEDLDRLWQQFKEGAVAALLQTTGIKSPGTPGEENLKLDRTVNTLTDEALKALEKIKERRKAKKEKTKKEAAP